MHSVSVFDPILAVPQQGRPIRSNPIHCMILRIGFATIRRVSQQGHIALRCGQQRDCIQAHPKQLTKGGCCKAVVRSPSMRRAQRFALLAARSGNAKKEGFPEWSDNRLAGLSSPKKHKGASAASSDDRLAFVRPDNRTHCHHAEQNRRSLLRAGLQPSSAPPSTGVSWKLVWAGSIVTSFWPCCLGAKPFTPWPHANLIHLHLNHNEPRAIDQRRQAGC